MSQSIYLKIDLKNQTLEFKAPANQLDEVQEQLSTVIKQFSDICQAHGDVKSASTLAQSNLNSDKVDVKHPASQSKTQASAHPKRPELTTDQIEQKSAIYQK